MRSPKLAKGSNAWYRYYAGYSAEFVQDAIADLGLGTDHLILDPWNGSGTTTAVSRALGVPAIGLDANPALVVIARARLLGADALESLEPLGDDIIRHAAEFREVFDEPDPLFAWFDIHTARETRSIERAIRQVLVAHSLADPNAKVDGLSSIAAVYYVALFHAVREQIAPYIGTNPTWPKSAPQEARVRLPVGAMNAAFRRGVLELRGKLQPTPVAATKVRVRRASSTEVPMSDDTVDAVVTSPPYLTRIDYVISAKPELAVLGYSDADLRALRDLMLGTPTITGVDSGVRAEWGETAASLLEAVEQHKSKASSGYYRKYFAQYLTGLWQSIAELRRVVRSGGRCLIVVQDSYYKEVHVDLAAIVSEMGAAAGFDNLAPLAFPVARTKASMNRGARSWRTSFGAVETVVNLA
ncbi:MAG TPA: hypothetical protein VHR55_02025 [Candidatus Limnocylindria bacterium]|nr:hypothetical protein [Candidatus Limnocylindria bacterium]